MRRALRKRLPALTHFYGLRPWEVERLSFGELAEYLDQLAAYEREMEALAKQAGR